MTKAALRRIYLEKQKSLSDVERSEKSLRIVDRFFEHFSLADVRFLHIFLPIEKNNEIDTIIFINRLRRDFPEIKILVSRVDFETLSLEILELDAAAKLALNRWKIPEPTNGKTTALEKIDVCLVPLLCFDERGFRVGYGKGFYDKFLSRCRENCLKIGLSYFAPTEKISDVQKFDVKLDVCLTPADTWIFSDAERKEK